MDLFGDGRRRVAVCVCAQRVNAAGPIGAERVEDHLPVDSIRVGRSIRAVPVHARAEPRHGFLGELQFAVARPAVAKVMDIRLEQLELVEITESRRIVELAYADNVELVFEGL